MSVDDDDDLIDKIHDEAEEEEQKFFNKQTKGLKDAHLNQIEFLQTLYRRGAAENDLESAMINDLLQFVGPDADAEKKDKVSFRELLQMYDIFSKNKNDFIANLLTPISGNANGPTLITPSSAGTERDITPAVSPNKEKQQSTSELQGLHKVHEFIDLLKNSEFSPEELNEIIQSEQKKRQLQNELDIPED